MREILFKGKTQDNEWIEGYYVLHKPSGVKRHYILRVTNGIEIASNCLIDIVPETVGQFTGLTDKNGKRIFENDICMYDEERWVVKWYEGGLRLEQEEPNYGFITTKLTDFSETHVEVYVEVIGNIHE